MKLLVPLIAAFFGAAALYTSPSWTTAAGLLALGLIADGTRRAIRARIIHRQIAVESLIVERAYARVHRIRAANAPKRHARIAHGDSAETGTDRRWRSIEVTIHIPDAPAAEGPVPLPLWTPGLIKLTGPGARNGAPTSDDRFGTTWGVVARVDVLQGGNWEPIASDKVLGSQRLRLLVGVPPHHDAFRLRYGFTVFENGGQDPS
jgi:hypothetical protein